MKLNYKIFIYILILYFLPSLKLIAQKNETKIIVSGRIVDDTNTPLPGAVVMVLETKEATATDVKGDFSIEVPHPKSKIQISYIGYNKRIVLADGNLNPIKLLPKAKDLGEVVVTGYAETSMHRMTGSAVTLPKEYFEKQVPTSLDNILQGLVAGVSVSAVSGRPGESYKIRIRGTGTLEGSSDPLWVIDGVPIQQEIPALTSNSYINTDNFNEIFASGIAGLNPNDIESVSILKDASAAAIYGSQAAGGVILVTTKKGKPGKPRINFSYNFTVGIKPQRDAGLMNTTEKLAWEQELWDEFAAPGSGSSHTPIVGIVGMINGNILGKNGAINTGQSDFEPMSEQEKAEYLKNISSHSTNWFNELFRNSLSSNYHLSMSGGSESSNYNVALGYTDTNGLVRTTDYKRYSALVGLNTKIGRKLSFGWNFNISKQESDGYSTNVNPFEYAYFANPYERPYNSDGTYRADNTYSNLASINGSTDKVLGPNGYNMLREINETSSKSDNLTVGGSLKIDYNFVKHFKFSSLASYTETTNNAEDIKGKNTYAAFCDRLSFDNHTQNTYASIFQSNLKTKSYNLRGQLSYSQSFSNIHSVNVLGGAEIRASKGKRIYQKQYGYNEKTKRATMPTPDPGKDPGTSSWVSIVNALAGQSLSENKYASFYALMDYSLYNRYVVNASFRTDGSTNFGSDQQFNPTWSAGVLWHLGEESFMANLKPIVSRLSIRLSTGFTGTVVRNVPKELVLKYGPKDWHGEPTASISLPPNPKLRWEKTKDMKLSLDFGLFNDRMTGLFEVYKKIGSDIVSNTIVSYTSGFSYLTHNTSEIQNKGLELTLSGSPISNKDFKMTLSGNIAWNKNKLTKFRNTAGSQGSAGASNGIGAGKYVGYPLNSIFYGKYRGIDPYDGLYSFQLRPDANVSTATDLNKTSNYRYYLGTSTAPYTGGFRFNISYKALSLSVGTAFSLKAKILNNTPTSPARWDVISYTSNEKPQSAYSDLYRNHLNVRRDAVDRWTPQNTTNTKYPRIVDAFGEKLNLTAYAPSSMNIIDGAFLEDVSYLRVRNITVSYALSKKMLRRTKTISSLSFNLTLSNFFTFTNYSGIDPETPGATYPITRSVSVGFNIGI